MNGKKTKRKGKKLKRKDNRDYSGETKGLSAKSHRQQQRRDSEEESRIDRILSLILQH